MEQNPNTLPPIPNTQPNTTSHIGFVGYKNNFNLLSSSPQIPYQEASFNLTSPPIQFPTSPYIQQNLFGQNPNLHQNLFRTFCSMPQPQKTTQPPPTQPLFEFEVETWAGGSRRRRGKGKVKVIAIESEEPTQWWTPQDVMSQNSVEP